MSINIQKMKPSPKVTQCYIFSKIATCGTSLNIPVNNWFWQFLELLKLIEILSSIIFFHIQLFKPSDSDSPTKHLVRCSFSACFDRAFSKYYIFCKRVFGRNAVRGSTVAIFDRS